MMASDIRHELVFETAWGWCAIAVTAKGLCGLRLPEPGKALRSRETDTDFLPGAEPAIRQVQEYFIGTRREFDVPIDLAGATPFQKRVWAALRTVGYGKTLSYGELAERIGQTGAARAVGRAVGSNPLPLIIPCHRVIGRNGNLCGFSAEGGVGMKRRLLEWEAAGGIL